MKYAIRFKASARKELLRLSPEVAQRISSAVGSLSGDPRPHGCEKLKQRLGWKIRVGDYRVIYEIDDGAGIVTVLKVGHRRQVYR